MEHEYKEYNEHEAAEHKMHMSREKKIHTLLERFEEEMEDACEYVRLAEEMPEEAVGLWLIGRDEVTHARFMHEVLEEYGHELSEEHEKKWHHVLKKYGLEG
jgi:uncharacterized protein YeaO (DUF488 family)